MFVKGSEALTLEQNCTSMSGEMCCSRTLTTTERMPHRRTMRNGHMNTQQHVVQHVCFSYDSVLSASARNWLAWTSGISLRTRPTSFLSSSSC